MLCWLLLANITTAADFLTLDQAFQTAVTVKNGQIKVTWTAQPKHYIYQESLALKLVNPRSDTTLTAPIISPKGIMKHDEFLGETLVHYNVVNLTQNYISAEPQTLEIKTTFQGCAEAGICYPPKTKTQTITLPASATPITGALNKAQTQSEPQQSESQQSDSVLTIKDSPQSWIYGLVVFYLLGLGLAFTPCVLPMVPILSSLILGQNHAPLTTRRGFSLSLSYVLGMAIVYTLIGLIIALSGARLQIYMQHPFILWPMAILFAALAFSLFGAFELRLPSQLHNRLYQLQGKMPGGRHVSVFIIGALSALIVSPCVSAPLVGALLFIAQDGEAVKGAFSLFFLAMGMGTPLLIIGTTGANILPRAGVWMDQIKIGFGFMMLAMALYIVKHLLPPIALYSAIGVLSSIIGMWLVGTTAGETRSVGQIFSKGVGLCFIIVTALSLHQAWQNIHPQTQSVQTTQKYQGLRMVSIDSLAGLDKALQQAKDLDKPVMIDVYADWCVACLELEHKTFSDPAVQALLAPFTLIRLDITNSQDTDQLLNRFNIIGPPTLVFFDVEGKEVNAARITGFVDADEFKAVLQNNKTRLMPGE